MAAYWLLRLRNRFRGAPWSRLDNGSATGRCLLTVATEIENHGEHRSAAFRLQKRATNRRRRTNFNALSITTVLQPKGRAPMRRWYARDAPAAGLSPECLCSTWRRYYFI